MEKTAQTTVQDMGTGAGGDAAAGEVKEVEAVNEADFEDEAGADKADGGGDAGNASGEAAKAGTSGDSDASKSPDKQSKETNAENARRRREERRRAELKATREKAIIETLGGKNPYTGEEMKDSADVEEYLAMKEIEHDGGDPLRDFAAHAKQKEREKAAEEEERRRSEEFYRKDREDFAAAHPDVDVDALIGDKFFRTYAQGKVGTVPLAEIYDGYLSLSEEFEKRAQTKAAQMIANAKATPGALTGQGRVESDFYTREQVAKMSQEEVHRNYDKIRRSMKNWKN